MYGYGFIYITTNNVNGKKYIGKRVYDSAGRWKDYFGSGLLLTRALNHYGKENFSRQIIDVAESSHELCEKERYWISYFDAVSSDKFYNIAPGGVGGNVRAGYSQEQYEESENRRIQAVSNASKKRYGERASMSKLSEDDVKDIIIRLLDNEFPSDIARDFGVSIQTIFDIRNKQTWTYLTGDLEFADISKRKRVSIRSKRPVSVFTKDMTYIATYPSAREAERCLGVGYRLISQVCHGEKPSANGYIFRFADSEVHQSTDVNLNIDL